MAGNPRIYCPEEMLDNWGIAMIRVLEEMIADIREGKTLDDTMDRHMGIIRHMMGRRSILAGRILQQTGPHRGPGTALYRYDRTFRMLDTEIFGEEGLKEQS